MSGPQATTVAISSREIERRLLMWRVKGVLCSERPSSAGRQGRIAGVVWCVAAVFFGVEELHTPAKTLPATRRQFERPAASRDKPLGERIGWCHDAIHLSRKRLVHVLT